LQVNDLIMRSLFLTLAVLDVAHAEPASRNASAAPAQTAGAAANGKGPANALAVVRGQTRTGSMQGAGVDDKERLLQLQQQLLAVEAELKSAR
jgi:hypothetical protein